MPRAELVRRPGARLTQAPPDTMLRRLTHILSCKEAPGSCRSGEDRRAVVRRARQAAAASGVCTAARASRASWRFSAGHACATGPDATRRCARSNADRRSCRKHEPPRRAMLMLTVNGVEPTSRRKTVADLVARSASRASGSPSSATARSCPRSRYGEHAGCARRPAGNRRRRRRAARPPLFPARNSQARPRRSAAARTAQRPCERQLRTSRGDQVAGTSPSHSAHRAGVKSEP